jgi:putative membrane protein
MFGCLGSFARWGAGGPFSDGFYGWMNGGWFAGFMLLKLIFWVLLVALVVYLIVKVSRKDTHSIPGGSSGVVADVKSALQILNERFARGEIDESTYLRMKSVLKGEATSKDS